MPNSTNANEAFYPPVGFHFNLSFTGIRSKIDFGFQEATGLDMEMGIEEVGCGGENRFKYRLPTVGKFNNLVLKRGLVPKNSSLASWVNLVLKSGLSTAIRPKTITLSLLDENADKLMSWDFINAYPVKWSISEFKSMDSAYVVETLEFAYNYFKKN